MSMGDNNFLQSLRQPLYLRLFQQVKEQWGYYIVYEI